MLGVTAAAAQQDPIAARKALMKANGDAAKTAGAMIKGDAPFDLAARTKFSPPSQRCGGQDAGAVPGQFEDRRRTPRPTSASPKIWENMADTSKRNSPSSATMPKRPQATVKDLDSFKAAFGNIGKNDCGACHQTYRLKKS